MPCYFCNKSTHVSEYCRDFPTLRSRYQYIFTLKQNSCLCPKYEPIIQGDSMCKCRKLCEACFQHHHIAMCPKRDLEHPSNPIIFPESLSLLSHHSPFAIRFFELCNPIDKFKLQNCCHFFKSLQLISFKLEPNFSIDKLPHPKNVVLNKYVKLSNLVDIQNYAVKNNYHFNFDNISLQRCKITKEDLKFLAKSDPHTICFENCFSHKLQDVLKAFPYAYDITYFSATIPRNWILNFLSVERKVNLQKITVNDYYLSFDVDDLILLFEQNPELVVTVHFDSIHEERSLAFIQLKEHSRFSVVNSEESYNLCIHLKIVETFTYYRFQRLY